MYTPTAILSHVIFMLMLGESISTTGDAALHNARNGLRLPRNDLSLPTSAMHAKVQINVAVLFPYEYIFHKEQVNLSLGLSVDHLKHLGLDARFVLNFNQANTNCNEVDGPIAAFDFYERQNVHVFIGPVCDYTLGHVAMYATSWNLPIITPGGHSHDFSRDKRDKFYTLTRVGVTFNFFVQNVYDLMKHFKWKKFKFFYAMNEGGQKGHRFCYLASRAFVHYANESKIGYSPNIIDKDTEYSKLLVDDVGNKFSGEYRYTQNIFYCSLYLSCELYFIYSKHR
ncbi:atrial natriuretic peptide receptor 3-like [Physella acuta]|uniref:atrial natriuretic peptide receptor 3-like n=1 Tax=Physella acuta TaxID=109671 RepID=UPI0027DC67E0|nr:atrial natriuretic peptide receptor 3-like [Physella acuta]